MLITFCLMLLTAFSESLTLLAFIPFISQITGLSNGSDKSQIYNTIFPFLNENNELIYPFFLFFILITGFLKTLDLFLCSDLTVKVSHDLSKRTYIKILKQPYDFHIYGEISNTVATLTTYIRDTHELIYNFLRLSSSSLLFIFVILTLLVVSLKITLFSFSLILCTYLLIAKYTKNILLKTSSMQVKASKSQTKLIQESLMSIRELKIWNAYNLFEKKYIEADWNLRDTQRSRMFIGSFPRYTVETLGIVVLLIICIFSSRFSTDGTNIIAIIGTFALGVQRLLPSTNQIYTAWSYINSFKDSTKNILKLLNNNRYKDESLELKRKYKLRSNILFENVSFKYPKGEKIVLNNINFTVNRGDIIGIIGKSGEGKSTLIDLIAGMLVPNNGKIYIDNKLLHSEQSNKFVLSWRSSLAYVSQDIYLFQGTFIDNIAFGVESKEVDLRRVKYAAKLAMIDEFIESNSKGYYDFIYENGKNLSGGQKQRLGIARALYRSQNLLILDEATSAVDPITEAKIFNNIVKSKELTTVFIISHNPNTLKYCNKSLQIKKGKLKLIK